MNYITRSGIACMLAVLISYSSFGFVNAVLPNTSAEFSTIRIMEPSPFAGMTIKEFLELTPRRFKELAGKKMSFSQKISLKIAQWKVKKLVRKNKDVDLMAFSNAINGNDFDIPGFILGIVLGPLGVLIAYLIEGKTSAMFRWAVVGALIWLGLFLLVVLIL